MAALSAETCCGPIVAAGAPVFDDELAPGVPDLKASAKRLPPDLFGGVEALLGAADALADGRAAASMALGLGGDALFGGGGLRGAGFLASTLRGSGFLGSGFATGRGFGGSITRGAGSGGNGSAIASGNGAGSPISGASSGAA